MRLWILVLVGLFGFASAQQSASLSGIIMSEVPLPEGTRVAVHVVDNDNVWGQEIVSVTPVAGTFDISPTSTPGELLPFRSGAVLLPGLQNEYRVSPSDGVRYAQGRITMYVDDNGNGRFDDRATDATFIGIATVEEPIGFFALIYVDRDATMSGAGVELQLSAGWNVFSVRYPGDRPDFAVQPRVDDAVLDVFLP